MELLTNETIRNPPRDEVSRNWTFILYPDESCGSWLYELQMLHIPTLISPRHNPALNGGDDDECGKKIHHHVMFCFHGNKTTRSMGDLIAYLRYRGVACTIAMVVHDKVALEEYFFHIGFPTKQQFATLDDCVCLNGYKLKVLDVDSGKVLSEIWQYISVTGEVLNYWSLMELAITQYPHWVGVITNKAYAVQTLLRSYELYGGKYASRIGSSKENIKIEQGVRVLGNNTPERLQETRVPRIR